MCVYVRNYMTLDAKQFVSKNCRNNKTKKKLTGQREKQSNKSQN